MNLCLKGLALCALGCLLLTGLFFVIGVRINTSGSIPVGLYWMTKDPIQKGDYVLFCPPQKPIFKEALARGYLTLGFCPGGYGHLMKRVSALTKDIISITNEGVFVNSQRVAYSLPLQSDGLKRALPQLRMRHYRLNNQELLLMTDQSPLSFDSRYFGLINCSQIQAVLKPILIWPSDHSLTS